MRKNRLLIVLFTGVAVLLSLASCTYDYFEDETNYQVFVPEVLNKTVSDCRVLVYNDAGTLVGARYATSPWDKDPRMEAESNGKVIKIHQMDFRMKAII